MESLPSARAAAQLGVSIQKFHRLTVTHDIAPLFQGSGRTGEKFWDPADIARLAELAADGDAA